MPVRESCDVHASRTHAFIYIYMNLVCVKSKTKQKRNVIVSTRSNPWRTVSTVIVPPTWRKTPSTASEGAPYVPEPTYVGGLDLTRRSVAWILLRACTGKIATPCCACWWGGFAPRVEHENSARRVASVGTPSTTKMLRWGDQRGGPKKQKIEKLYLFRRPLLTAANFAPLRWVFRMSRQSPYSMVIAEKTTKQKVQVLVVPRKYPRKYLK